MPFDDAEHNQRHQQSPDVRKQQTARDASRPVSPSMPDHTGRVLISGEDAATYIPKRATANQQARQATQTGSQADLQAGMPGVRTAEANEFEAYRSQERPSKARSAQTRGSEVHSSREANTETRASESRTAEANTSKASAATPKRTSKASATAAPKRTSKGKLDTPSPLLPEEAYRLPREQRRQMTKWWDRTIVAFKATLVVGMVVGCLFFLRPSVSQAENRTLTQFPEITWDSFVNGDFFTQVSLWYSDTYPFRDQLIALDRTMKSLFGIQMSTQYVGETQQADEIPVEVDPETVQEAEPADEPAKLPEEYDASDLEVALAGEIMNGAYVKDGAVYTVYYFTQEAATAYARAINKAHTSLEGTDTNVYSILAPSNSGVLLSEDEMQSLGGSNQQQAIEYYYSLYDDGITTIPTYQPLYDHKSEYLFFKTDHHWTALGAYYVYRSLCEVKGIEPHELDQFVEQDFPDFKGTYSDILASAGVTDSVDTVQAWIPMGTNDMTFINSDGAEVQWKIVEDVSEWAQNSKYNTFIGGDQPFSTITNPEITDGSSCVVVKESFGNALVPWLVDHYQTVYVIDFRYYNSSVTDFCKENNVQDLIIANNISIAGNVDVAGKIESLM